MKLKLGDFLRDREGILYISMYSTLDVAAGQFLRWLYDPFAGAGGSNSWMFPTD